MLKAYIIHLHKFQSKTTVYHISKEHLRPRLLKLFIHDQRVYEFYKCFVTTLQCQKSKLFPIYHEIL